MMIPEKIFAEQANIFASHCIGEMEEFGQLTKEDIIVEFGLITEDGLLRVEMIKAIEQMEEDHHYRFNIKDALTAAQISFSQKNEPWISCTNLFMAIDEIKIKGTRNQIEEKLDKIIEKAKKMIEDQNTNKNTKTIIPRKIEVLYFELFNGEKHAQPMIARVRRTQDKTTIDKLLTMNEIIETLDKSDMAGIIDKEHK